MSNDLNFYPLDREELMNLIECFDNYKHKLTTELDEDQLDTLETIIEKAKLELDYYSFDDDIEED